MVWKFQPPSGKDSQKRSATPRKNPQSRAQVVPINASSNAILINSEMCGGGNKNGQYLVVAQNGKSEVITNAEIGDMSFLGKITHVDGDVIYLSGMRWLENDPHCCPSKDAVLEYNVKTHKHGFKLTANRAN
jgi:hypothetical protein